MGAFNPFGYWECFIKGEEGSAFLDINTATHLFTIDLPTGDKFQCLFHAMLADDDKVGIVLLTPDHIAHPVNLIENGEGIIVEFHDEKLAPKLQCNRKKIIGH